MSGVTERVSRGDPGVPGVPTGVGSAVWVSRGAASRENQAHCLRHFAERVRLGPPPEGLQGPRHGVRRRTRSPTRRSSCSTAKCDRSAAKSLPARYPTNFSSADAQPTWRDDTIMGGTTVRSSVLAAPTRPTAAQPVCDAATSAMASSSSVKTKQ